MKWPVMQLTLCVLMWSFIIAFGVFVMQSKKRARHTFAKNQKITQPRMPKGAPIAVQKAKLKHHPVKKINKKNKQDKKKFSVDFPISDPFSIWAGSVVYDKNGFGLNHSSFEKNEIEQVQLEIEKNNIESKRAISKMFANALKEIASEPVPPQKSHVSKKNGEVCVQRVPRKCIMSFPRNPVHHASSEIDQSSMQVMQDLASIGSVGIEQIMQLLSVERSIIDELLSSSHAVSSLVAKRKELLGNSLPTVRQVYETILTCATQNKQNKKSFLQNMKTVLDHYYSLIENMQTTSKVVRRQLINS